MSKRKVKVCVISDLHLGTYGCQAKSINKYLKSIDPKILILNGDIIDIWQFSKRYWPESHMKVVQRITKMLSQGTQIYYLTGNHDEMLRKFTDFKLGKFEILNKLVLTLDGKRAWIFHGDVFDITMKHSKWLAKLGAIGYDTLILINSFVNWLSKLLGRGPVSLSKKIKQGVKSAIKFIDDFEQTAIDIAIANKYDYVICGHIHQPGIKHVTSEKGETIYLNSGDWVENCTALEYHKGEWKLYHFKDDEYTLLDDEEEEEPTRDSLNIEQVFNSIVNQH